MAVHERLDETMNHSCADWAIDLETPLYTRTSPDPIHGCSLDLMRPLQTANLMKHVIHVLRSLRRCALDNSRTKCRWGSLGPV